MKDYDLSSPTARRKLPPRHTPYPTRLHKGLTLLYRKSEAGGETWQVRARVGGKYEQAPLGPVTPSFCHKEASAAAREQESKWLAGDVVDDSLTVSQLVEKYIDAYAPLKKNPNWRGETTKRATQVVHNRSIGTLRLGALRPKHIAALQRELGEEMKPASVNRACSILRAALNWGFREEMIATQPHATVPRAKERGAAKRKKFTIPEVSSMIQGAPAALQPILTCMALTGCRPVGARRLLVEDVDLKSGVVWFKSLKGDSGEEYKTYYTSLTEAGAAFFEEQIKDKEPGDYVFTTASGKPWSERNLPGRFRTYREAAELEGWDTLYSIRHSVITAVIKQGMPVVQAAEEYGTSVEYIQNHYYERDDNLARKFAPVLEVAC